MHPAVSHCLLPLRGLLGLAEMAKVSLAQLDLRVG